MAGLQIVGAESGRGKDLCDRLRQMEFQTLRLVENPHVNLASVAIRDATRDKSIDLMISVVTFFNTALRYFGRSFSSKNLNFGG
jgi:hypothetical protein